MITKKRLDELEDYPLRITKHEVTAIVKLAKRALARVARCENLMERALENAEAGRPNGAAFWLNTGMDERQREESK